MEEAIKDVVLDQHMSPRCHDTVAIIWVTLVVIVKVVVVDVHGLEHRRIWIPDESPVTWLVHVCASKV